MAAPALIYLEVPAVAAHLVVFYAACLSNITPPVCVSAFAAAALAKADPMQTGIAALKFGIALIFLPFGFVYLPPLLMNGSVWAIAYTFFILIVGFMAVAMALQGADFINPKISVQRRVIFGASALLFLLPAPLWVNLIGFILLGIGWVPGIIAHRRTATA